MKKPLRRSVMHRLYRIVKILIVIILVNLKSELTDSILFRKAYPYFFSRVSKAIF